MTSIEWTGTPRPDGSIAPGYTFNPWIGCSKVHAGCTNCYAEADQANFRRRVVWGVNGTRSKTSEANWGLPLRWNREAEKAGQRRRVFCASLADVFEDWDGPILDHHGKRLAYDIHQDPASTLHGFHGNRHRTYRPPTGQMIFKEHFEWTTMDDLRVDLFTLIDATPWLDWLLLTKRPENIRRMTLHWLRSRMGAGLESPDEAWRQGLPIHNLWLGTSISDQATADEWIPRLLACRDLAPVLFVSAEPLLGPIDFQQSGVLTGRDWGGSCPICKMPVRCRCEPPFPSLDWVIVGGESGPNARPCDVAWVRSIVGQCHKADVACFVKQLGSEPRPSALPSDVCVRFLKDKKGGDPNDWPEDLRVREFPNVTAEAVR